jgi:putative acyl-CoA dehydrogenase
MSTDVPEMNAPKHFSDALGYATHEVLNQPGSLADYDAYSDDKPLADAVNAFGGGWAEQTLRRAGLEVGSAKVQQLARQANRNLPELRTHDRFGNRIDVVEFHPAYHELMRLIYETQAHSFAWTHRDERGAHVARAALSYMWNQGENGICCPMGMTFASIPALQHDKGLYDEWVPRILRAAYDDRPIYAKKKNGITVGMAMTEKQGGSDLRATITTGRPATSRRGSGAPYLLTGHKWFFSVPMSDVFLTLAQTEKGLSCFIATGGWRTVRGTGLKSRGSRTNAATNRTRPQK